MKQSLFASKSRIFALILALLLVATGAGLLVYEQALGNQETTVLPELTREPRFVIPGINKIRISRNLFDDGAFTKTLDFNEVLAFDSGHAVVTRQNILHYIQLDSKGEIVRDVEIGPRPDMVLSMARKLLIIGDKAVYVYVIPLRGIKVIAVAADNSIIEKFNPLNEFFRLYTDNDIWVNGDNIFIPNGDLQMLTINTTDYSIANQTLEASTCGAGDWDIYHNIGTILLLRSAAEVCIMDSASNALVSKFALSGNFWFHLIPELKSVAVEAWEMRAGFPTSTGTVDFYAWDSGLKVNQIDLTQNPDFQTESASSPGGYSLIESHLIDPVTENLYLFTRAGKNLFKLEVNNEFKMENFTQIPENLYCNTWQVNN